MPGHKRNNGFIDKDLLGLDLTEVPGMDNLLDPQDVLKSMQQRIASIYKADESLFCVNGSTVGILSAICAVCGEDDLVIVDRNTHRAVYSGLALSGARPVYIMPVINDIGMSVAIQPVDVERAFKKNPSAKALVINGATYEGFVPDIKTIADTCHRYGAVLIVDEAHGAHFAFHEAFPTHAVALGADIVINSLHKTLPALSQSAVLHMRGDIVDKQRVSMFLQMLQTSSPSYMMMASADDMLCKLNDETQHFDRYVGLLKAARKHLSELKHISILSPESTQASGAFALDIGKIVLFGQRVEKSIRNDYNIELEYLSKQFVIAMASVADTQEGFERLVKAFEDIDDSCGNEASASGVFTDITLVDCSADQMLPAVALTPRQSLGMNHAYVNIDDATDLICGEIVAAYPPGVPLAVFGEVLTRDVLDRIHVALPEKKRVCVCET